MQFYLRGVPEVDEVPASGPFSFQHSHPEWFCLFFDRPKRAGRYNTSTPLLIVGIAYAGMSAQSQRSIVAVVGRASPSSVARV
jgi:hypothetical protein